MHRRGLATMAALVAALGTATAARSVPAGYGLVWADEFDGQTLDAARWRHHQLGPRRDAVNLAEAVRLDGAGNLVIDTWTENGVHHTGMIDTKDRFEPTYGWFEARIEFDSSPGMWSAFWLQSPTYGSVIGDPGASGVEIDVQEHRIECAPGCDLADFMTSTVHWDGYGAQHKQISSGRAVPGLAGGFHVYAFEWTPTAYRFYIDGELLWEPENPPVSHVPEYLLLSSEVEDVLLWAGFAPPGGYGTRETSTTRMVVDYVRAYQAVPEPASAALLGAGLAWLARRGRLARRSSLCEPSA